MRMRWTAAVVLAASVAAGPAAAQDDKASPDAHTAPQASDANGANNSPIASDTPTDGGSNWAGYGSLGVAFLPEYEGSNSYELLPYAEGRLNYQNYYLRFEGGQLRFNILDDERFHIGPLIGFRRGRGNVNSPVHLFHHLDDTETVGGFFEWEYTGKDPRYGATITVSADDAVYGEKGGGWTIVGRVTARRPLDFINPGFIVSWTMDTSWGSASYMRTYFGVDQADSLASGLSPFRPGAGFANWGVALSVDQFLSRHFSVGLRGHYGREIGGAASSPVTSDPNQFFAGAVVGYVL